MAGGCRWEGGYQSPAGPVWVAPQRVPNSVPLVFVVGDVRELWPFLVALVPSNKHQRLTACRRVPTAHTYCGAERPSPPTPMIDGGAGPWCLEASRGPHVVRCGSPHLLVHLGLALVLDGAARVLAPRVGQEVLREAE